MYKRNARKNSSSAVLTVVTESRCTKKTALMTAITKKWPVKENRAERMTVVRAESVVEERQVVRVSGHDVESEEAEVTSTRARKEKASTDEQKIEEIYAQTIDTTQVKGVT